MSAFFALIRRDLLRSATSGSLWLPVIFFLLVATLYPFAVGPDPAMLARTGGGMLWVAALLAALLPVDRLFLADKEAGVLDQLAVRGVSDEIVVLAKLVAHWLGFAVPLLIACFPASALLNLSGKSLALLLTGLLIGSPALAALAVMVAAALDLPVTTLLGDPGATGARAVAENVSEESWAVFSVRQDLWSSVISQLVAYAIDQAAIAPLGSLTGTIRRDGDRQYVDLPEGDDRTIIVAFPEHDTTDITDVVTAIVKAQQTETVPPLVIARALMQALEIPDVDEVLTLITDEDTGLFIPLDMLEQHVRERVAERGGLVL